MLGTVGWLLLDEWLKAFGQLAGGMQHTSEMTRVSWVP